MYHKSFEYGINSRIIQVRKLKNLTQAQLAERLGYKSSSYSQMERIGNIPAAIVRNIADIFAIDVRYFLYGEKYCDLINETKPEETESKKDEQQLVLSRKEQEVIRLLRLFEKEEREEVHNLIGKIYNLKREKKSSK